MNSNPAAGRGFNSPVRPFSGTCATFPKGLSRQETEIAVTDSPFASFVGPTLSESIGAVLSVRGSEACVGLPAPSLSEDLRVTVGSFLAISAGRHRLIGVVTEVAGAEADAAARFGAVARLDMMGEIDLDATGAEHFSRGVSTYPAIGDPVRIIGRDELRLVYKATSARSIAIGALHNDETIEARVDIDNLVSKHFAVLGSTGVGKSSGVAVLLNEILDARPNLRVFLLDGHNEYGRCFGSRANVVNAATLKLPFWLFNFEEFVDALYYGRPGVEEEIDILAELIPMAKGMYQGHRGSGERAALRRVERRAGYGVDTPVPYMIQDLVALIDERMGKLENRASRMRHHHLLTRIDGLRNDARYAFMFENANVGGDTMGDILSFLFRLGENGQPMTVLQVAGLPMEVLDAVVSVLCRLAFDFGLWSDGAMPMLFVCEEAHRYAAADRSVGFAPTRRALLRIAKEGRKYGVYLGLVTQRPAELDPTIIAQCSTLFAMRMANDRDQALL
ncbi:MAG: ATP-binding protein, partial [Hyphomicrobiales bacterium]|nr:ATP-binding protein [Hyphomicrobiales bacterium]